MEFRILGRLEVWDGAHAIPLGGPKPRALLAVLLLHANEVVPADRLIDDLWRDDLPENAAAALQVNLSRLRKSLPRDVVATRSPGYVVHVEPDALDLDRFDRLVDEGRTLLGRGRPPEASERLREALSLWRGPALSDFAYESFAQPAIARFEEIRLTAVELRVEADLARGRHDALVGELNALVVEHPLRERLRRQLMIALYRSGRQAEALDVYKDARRALVDELGIEPSAALQELERAILRQDPSLELKPLATVAAPEHTERAVLVAIGHEERAGAVLAIAETLARDPPRVVIMARLVAEAADLQSASAWLQDRRSELRAHGIIARAASFTATAPGKELARLATELDVDLLLTDAPDELLTDGRPGEQLAALLAETPCDVALLAARDVAQDGAVIVPFGGAEHDWAAVELGAWVARAEQAPLRLAGVTAVPEHGKRDASRLLSHAALAIQRVLGIAADPLLTPPGEEHILEATRDARLLVVGLSTRWHAEGLGPARLRLARDAGPPTLLVRRGLRPGGVAPPATLTRFTWSVGS
jgi:DNA-binding SARP family transcriptional activator